MAVPGCATHDTGDAFDDSFDSAWMAVVPVDRSALPGYCQREDRQNLLGCARPYQDPPGDLGAMAMANGGGGAAVDRREPSKAGVRGTCVIYVARDLVRDSANFDYVLRHEARHCRGWRHPGD